MNDPQVVALFSTPLYINKIPLGLDLIEKVITTPCKGDNGGYNNGWMSDTKWLDDQPEIRRIVEDHLAQYLYGVLAIDPDKHPMQLTSSWVNKHKPGDGGGQHSHSNSMFSGVMYFQTPRDSGDIVFTCSSILPTYCTQTLYPEVVDYNQYNMREANITPQEGMIMFFPSHLSHYVKVNKSKEDRYSMAFNYILRGEYGMRDSHLVL